MGNGMAICCATTYGKDKTQQPRKNWAVQNASARMEKYISRNELNKDLCIEAPPINSDAELFNFAVANQDKSNLQAILINSSKVFSNSRGSEQEADVQGMAELANLIQKNQNLVVFHLNGQRLDRETFQALVKGMSNHRALKVIDLYDNKITDDGAAYVFNNIKDNPVQKIELNLGANDVHTSQQLKIKGVLDTAQYKGKVSVVF